MISRVTLTNFQGFKGTQSVRFAPVTLVFGPNAAGKSSLGRALRLLKQSVGKTSTLNFTGPDVALGGFRNTRFGQSGEPNGSMSIALRISGDIAYSVTTSGYGEDESTTHALGLDLGSDASPSEPSVSLTSDALGGVSITVNDAAAFRDFAAARGYFEDEIPAFDDLNGALQELFDRNVLVSRELQFKTLHGAHLMVNQTGLEEFIERQSSVIEDILDTMVHVGPTREITPRITSPQNTLLEFNKSEGFARANRWLARLTNNRFQVIRKNEIVGAYEVGTTYVKDLFTQAECSFSDVGQGLGQVFPVLEALFTPPGQLIRQNPNMGGFVSSWLVLLEQPELHLHPKMQADLIDAVIDAITPESLNEELVEDDWTLQEPTAFVLVETHSEAMLLRLQKAIRLGRLSPSDATIVFVEPSPIDESNTHSQRYNVMRNIDFTVDGELTESPMALSFAGLRLADLLDD